MDETLKKAIQLMAEGKEEGFNKVYSETYNHVYFRAKGYMKNEEDALDLTQIVYVEAYKNIKSLQNPDALFGWLDGITLRQGMKLFRKKKDVLLSEDGEGIFETLENEDVSVVPELTADQKATSEIVKGLIDELPELQRVALVAYYFDGMSVGQIAEMQECSEGTVKSRLNYARKYLKDRVEEKEKKEGYRIHVFTLPTLWYAIKMLAEETTLTAKAAQAVYGMSCAKVGLTATAITVSTATAQGAAISATAASSTSVAAGVADGTVKAVGIGAKFASLSLTAKIAIVTGAVIVAGAAVGAAVHSTSSQQTEEIVEAVSEVLPEIEVQETEDSSEDVVIERKLSEYLILLTHMEENHWGGIQADFVEGNTYRFPPSVLEMHFEEGQETCFENNLPEGVHIKSFLCGDYDSPGNTLELADQFSATKGELVPLKISFDREITIVVALDEGVTEEELIAKTETPLEESESTNTVICKETEMQITNAIAYFSCMPYQFGTDGYVWIVRNYIQTVLNGDGMDALPFGWTSDIITQEQLKEFCEKGLGVLVPDDYTYDDFGITCDSEMIGEMGADYFRYEDAEINQNEDGTYSITGSFVWGAEGEESVYSYSAEAVSNGGNMDLFGGFQIVSYNVQEGSIEMVSESDSAVSIENGDTTHKLSGDPIVLLDSENTAVFELKKKTGGSIEYGKLTSSVMISENGPWEPLINTREFPEGIAAVVIEYEIEGCNLDYDNVSWWFDIDTEQKSHSGYRADGMPGYSGNGKYRAVFNIKDDYAPGEYFLEMNGIGIELYDEEPEYEAQDVEGTLTVTLVKCIYENDLDTVTSGKIE